ncbi:hypothetical protein [Dactylosporangium sp. CA-139066]|uniref:hypothetical protein n=1 Tax=Dactylosporangium sp. CA-139066 TaxID=3239930 RepID=UPI003D8C033D
MHLKKAYVGAGILALGTALAFAVPATASAQAGGDPTIRIAKQAKLSDGGVTDTVTLSLACPAGMQAHLSTTVTQKLGTFEVAFDTGTLDVVCQGGTQKVQIPVAGNPLAPYRPGTADATAHGEFYDSSVGYFIVNDQRLITNVA